MLLAINYHYIGSEDAYTQGIYPVSVERFERQLIALRHLFTFVGQEEILQAIDGIEPLPEYAAVVTFDDGLRCQYDLALPILKKYNIPAIFFVCGLPYDQQRALLAHKIHWCRAHVPPKEFFEIVTQEYTHLTGLPFSLDSLGVSDAAIQAQYLYDNRDEARLKFLLNKSALPIEVRDAVIHRMFSRLVPDEAGFCRQMYISRDGIRELAHMKSIGVHGYSHIPLGSLDQHVVRHEVGKTREVVMSVVNDDSYRLWGISYPHGAPAMISESCAAVAKEYSFVFGFSMERAFNLSLAHPLLLGRLDANDIPEGKAPLFEIDSRGVRIRNDRLTFGRRILAREPIPTLHG